MRISRRPADFIKNHYEGEKLSDVIKGVVESIADDDFRKTMELEKIPGVMADVYKPTYDDFDWYVKFFLDEDGVVALVVMSCNWDGVTH